MTIGNAIFWASDSSPISDPKIYAHELVHASVQSPLLGDNYLPATIGSYEIGALVSLFAGNTSMWDMHDASPLEIHASQASNTPTKGPSIWRKAMDNLGTMFGRMAQDTLGPIGMPWMPTPLLP